jgi:iron complex outermembrane receptor protein
MNTSKIAVQKWLRAPSAPADSVRTRQERRLDPGGRLAVSCVASLLACAAVLSSTLPAAAQAPEPAPAPAPEGSPEASPPPPEGEPEEGADFIQAEGVEEIVVSGFRSSLSAALDRKQRSTAQVDAIVADDMADFPDLNLAEALQRIPGIAITRTYGEGQQITVRGLGGLYTRVRVNGMETRAAVGNNTGRNFDFSVFASELFNSVVVHKTASADLDEGSLGAVVDLNTARAFDYKKGLTLAVNATGAYNDLSQTVRPRLTGLIAYHDPGGIWGATASAAYSATRTDSASADTVNWQKGAFRSVEGVVCGDNPADPGCAAVAGAFHPRIPRYGQEVNSNHRLGLTAGLQLRPTDQTEIRLDGLYASYDQTNDRRWLELLFRGNEPGMDITGYTLKSFPARFGTGNDSIIAAELDNAWVRAERNPIRLESNYHQLSLTVDQRFSDSFYVNALAGTTRSTGHSNDATVDYDIRDYDGYSYDYSNDRYPSLVHRGPDVTDATNFFVPELRDRYADTKTGFDTLELNLHYDPLEQLRLAAGVNYKRATLDTEAANRDGTVCGLNLYDCDADDDGTNELIGPPGDPALSDSIRYPGKVGSGSTTRWVDPSLEGWFTALGYRNVPLTPDLDGTYKVTEHDLGYYLQARGEIPIGAGEMRLMYDGGVRYVETRQTSSGYNSAVYVTIDRPVYRDLLPSANLALWFSNELVLRLAAANVMARPALNNLSPGGTVDSFGYTISNQNPFLDPTRATALDASVEWYFADNAILSLAVFYKSIDSFPIRQSRTGTFASTGLPRSVIQNTSPADLSGPDAEGTCGNPEGCWEISELTNGPGASLGGLEVGFQAPLTAFYKQLPPVIRGLGIVANYTFVDSKVDYDFSGNTITDRLIGLSNGSYNATLYYEDSKFSARVSVAHRSDYLTGGPNANGNLWNYTEPETRFDLSSSYSVNEHLKFTFEMINFTNTPIATGVDVDANRRVLYNHTGRNFLLGARLTY